MTARWLPDALRRAGDWPARYSRASFFVLIALAAIGTIVAVRTPVDRLVIPVPAALRVRAELPGVDAATIEAAVTKPLEQALAPLPGQREIESRSRYGATEIFIRLTREVDRDQALANARALVANSAPRLPAGMKAPVADADHTHDPPAAVYVVTAANLTDELVHWVRNVLVDPLREVPEIASVTIEGVGQPEIRIQPEPRRLAALGLSFDDLIAAVHRRDMAPRRGSARRQVVTPGSAESVAARAVRLPNGEPIALAEVASVSVAPGATTGRLRYGNSPALRLEIYPRTPADAVSVADRAHAHLAWLRANDLVPPGATIHTLHNESRATAQWLKRILQRAGICLAIILAIVGAALGVRTLIDAAFAFAVWLPVSVAGLGVFGYTLNVATAAGVMLAGAPCTALLTSRFVAADLRRVAVIGAAAWLAGIVFAVNAQASAAFAVGLIAAALVRWLMIPWLSQSAAASAPPSDIKSDAAHAKRRRSIATVTAILSLISVGISVYLLPAVGASEHGGTFAFRLRGDDPRRLDEIVDPLMVSLHVIPNVQRIVSSTEQEETWRLKLDPERMQAVGIGLAEIGRALAIAREGLVVGEIVNADRRLQLRMQLAPGAAGESFERLLLRGETANQPAIYLRHVGVAEKTAMPRAQIRIDGEPAVEITALWRNAEARDALQDFCDRVVVPKGYSLECVTRDSLI